MRRVAVVGPVGWTLACGGAGTPAPAPAPIPVPAPPPEDDPPSGVAVWVPRDGGCSLIAYTTPQSPGEQLAHTDGTCATGWILAASPDRTHLVATFDTGRVVIVDVAAKTAVDAAPPDVPGTVEGVGYSDDGKLIAVVRLDSDATEDTDAHTVTVKATGGEAFPVAPDEVGGANAYFLCGAYTFVDGAWTRTAAAPLSLGEGTAPPFCLNYSELPKPAATFDPHVTVAFGDFGTPVADPTGLPEPPASSGWQAPFGADAEPPYAEAAITLEGSETSAPLLVKLDGKWRPVEGFAGGGGLSINVLDGYFLACDGAHSALVRTRDARVVWSAESAMCAIPWPLSG